eukprot:m.44103 g.44103  ORF g.44103 m.44103 type:complete len:976 (+) comp10049_c0_seq1:208-3135(+)
MRCALTLALLAISVGSAIANCFIEPGRHYDSQWNLTALRYCDDVTHSQSVCVIGGGMSGLHMAYLLGRRAYRVTVFEREGQPGGKVHSLNTTDGMRELGATFLSPDYVEVRALMDRFNISEAPLSASQDLRFHFDNKVTSPAKWYNSWVSNITKSNNITANNDLVNSTLQRYFSVHASIFGNYEGRLPPQPKTASQLLELNGTFMDFMDRHKLNVLQPLFYQFYTMQGMGQLTMPAYYVLKWCNPVSMRVGGFGNDRDTPLAVVKEGYQTLARQLANGVGVDLRLDTPVRSIHRYGTGSLVVYEDPENKDLESMVCDILVLSGDITQYVSGPRMGDCSEGLGQASSQRETGSQDGNTAPILQPATPTEETLFGNKSAMQFLVSLVNFTNIDSSYRAIEYWPQGGFVNPGEVILRRDVAYAEETPERPHTTGGLQSMSTVPAPACNCDIHQKKQQEWISSQGFTVESLLSQRWYADYLPFYSVDDVMALKPWRTREAQMLEGVRTLYIGGSVSFDTIEDSFQYNLELAANYFDTPKLSPAVSSVQPFIEQVLSYINCSDIDKFFTVDNETWTTFLEKQDGYLGKISLLDPTEHNTSDIGNTNSICTIRSTVHWNSWRQWKAIPGTELTSVAQNFIQKFGYQPQQSAFPSDHGLAVANFVGAHPFVGKDSMLGRKNMENAPKFYSDVFEENYFNISCSQVAAFVKADNMTWNKFLSQQLGFVRKFTLVDPQTNGTSCTVWTITEWLSRDLWKSISPSDLASTQAKFVSIFGSSPALHRYPTSLGLDVVTQTNPGTGAVLPAINGNDVVAYHSLKSGDLDIRGEPQFNRSFPSSFLNSSVRSQHLRPYIFWFVSEENAQTFESNPWKYIPAFGGHCTHGIASRNDLTPDSLTDGRVAFTCVNTTQWKVINESLYMNSCGMYKDFIVNPAKDITIASSVWQRYFGSLYSGPINDACFQNGAYWNGNPVGALIPANCVTN